MTGSGTAARRALALWAVAWGLWVFVEVLKYAGTWQDDMIGLGFAMLVAGVMAALARRRFRRSIARPLSRGGSGIAGWLVRQPRWRSGLIVSVLWLAVPIAIIVCVAESFHRHPPAWQLGWLISGCLIASAGQAVFRGLVWQRQHESGLCPDGQLDHGRS